MSGIIVVKYRTTTGNHKVERVSTGNIQNFLGRLAGRGIEAEAYDESLNLVGSVWYDQKPKIRKWHWQFRPSNGSGDE